jgi:hypothetical protein
MMGLERAKGKKNNTRTIEYFQRSVLTIETFVPNLE